MTERDQELYDKCCSELSEDEGYYPVFDEKKFADLIRADEREACLKIVELEAIQYSEPVWAFEIVNDILARGNT